MYNIKCRTEKPHRKLCDFLRLQGQGTLIELCPRGRFLRGAFYVNSSQILFSPFQGPLAQLTNKYFLVPYLILVLSSSGFRRIVGTFS